MNKLALLGRHRYSANPKTPRIRCKPGQGLRPVSPLPGARYASGACRLRLSHQRVFVPRIGLLSDSHGRASTSQQAVDVLLEKGATCLIHLGDIGTVEVIDALITPAPDSEEPVESHLVFGNTDWDMADLARYAEDMGIQVDHPLGRISLPDGGVLAYCHGHEEEPMEAALRDGVRYLCHGHTHRASDTQKGATRVLNPGALFRANQYTCAILDTDADSFDLINVAP